MASQRNTCRVKTSGGRTVSIGYDALGRCVSKTVPFLSEPTDGKGTSKEDENRMEPGFSSTELEARPGSGMAM